MLNGIRCLHNMPHKNKTVVYRTNIRQYNVYCMRGNGYAAKSADAIGKIACDMVLKCIFCENLKTRYKEGEDILSSWNSACATIFEPEVFVP